MAEADDLPRLRERLERRMSGLCMERAPHEATWRDISDNMQVRRSRWLSGDAWRAGQAYPMGRDAKPNTKLLDPTAVRASDVLANGLSSGLVSPSRPWFRLTTVDPDLRDRQNVKEWLKTVQDRIYELFGTTNFYSQSKAGYRELGLFGQEAGVITQHWRRGAVTQALETGEYWISVGDELTPDSLYRACPMTVAQVVQTFAPPYGTGRWSHTVQSAYDRGEYDTIIPIMHAIEPNPDHIPGRTDRRSRKWRSVYWECGEDRQKEGAGVLAFDGFSVQPFWAARWAPTGAHAYSMGPGHASLGSCRQLQLQVLRKSQAVDLMVKPPLRAPVQMESRHIANVPGGITYSTAQDKDAWGPLYEVRPDVSQLREDIAETQSEIKDAFYVQLFLAILNADGEMTATEVNLRNMEKYAQLGPVIEANMNEKLRPVIDIAYDILERNGVLPPPPQELGGAELHVEFVSSLSQMQRAGEINAIGQVMQFSGSLVAVDPQVMDTWDLDKVVKRFGDLQGIDADLERSDDAVQALRDARVKQQQAAQAQQIAPAAKDGAQAAQALASIDPAKLQALTGAGGYQ